MLCFKPYLSRLNPPQEHLTHWFWSRTNQEEINPLRFKSNKRSSTKYTQIKVVQHQMNDAYIHWKQALWFHFIAFKSFQRTITNRDYKFSWNSLSHSLLSCPLSIFRWFSKPRTSALYKLILGLPHSTAFPAKLKQNPPQSRACNVSWLSMFKTASGLVVSEVKGLVQLTC